MRNLRRIISEIFFRIIFKIWILNKPVLKKFDQNFSNRIKIINLSSNVIKNDQTQSVYQFNCSGYRYIHLLAHHKLHKQIREQIQAFDKGFKSIIRQEWLNSFTLSEIQTLISGSTVDLDLEDLKENVQYWGGLHAQHRLIKWLWDIVEFDFSRAERELFLKFVTSSSKPPLLGDYKYWSNSLEFCFSKDNLDFKFW